MRRRGHITATAEYSAIASGTSHTSLRINYLGIVNDLTVIAAVSLIVLGQRHRFHVRRVPVRETAQG